MYKQILATDGALKSHITIQKDWDNIFVPLLTLTR